MNSNEVNPPRVFLRLWPIVTSFLLAGFFLLPVLKNSKYPGFYRTVTLLLFAQGLYIWSLKVTNWSYRIMRDLELVPDKRNKGLPLLSFVLGLILILISVILPAQALHLQWLTAVFCTAIFVITVHYGLYYLREMKVEEGAPSFTIQLSDGAPRSFRGGDKLPPLHPALLFIEPEG